MKKTGKGAKQGFRPGMKVILAFVVALSVSCGCSLASAEGGSIPKGFLWQPMSDEDLVRNSDVIVVGKVVWVENGKISTSSTDTASILVQKVLKGRGSDVLLPLAFPGRNRGYLTWSGAFKSTRSRRDIFFDMDQEGIWFLKRSPVFPGKYVVDNPARFKPLVFLARYEEAVRRYR